MAVAVLVVVGGGVVTAYVSRPSPDRAAAPLVGPTGAVADPYASFRVAAPREGRRSAVLVLASDAAAVRLRAGVTDGDLVRASSPGGGSVRPRVRLDGDTAELDLVRTGGPGAEAVDVVVSADVRWTVRVEGGLNSGDLDLSRARIGRVELAGDAADIALRLPGEALPVVVTGGINRLRVAVGEGAPVRVRARGGAGRAVIDGRTVRGVASGRVLETGRRAGDGDRVDVDMRAGVGEIRVDVG